MKKKTYTIKDIAETLGLNVSTVSRALHNSESISEETRRKVWEMAKKLNYRPNNIAASLRKGKGQTVGLIVPNINRNFFSNLIAGVEQVLGNAGYNVLICQSNELFVKEKKAVETLLNARVACIMLSISKETQDSKHLVPIVDEGIPLIQVDRVIEELDTYKILNNNLKGAFQVVKHLIENGYRRIVHLAGPLHINIYRERAEGYRRAVERFLPDAEVIIMEDILTTEKGFETTIGLFSGNNTPDAIFAASDFSALGAVKALKQLGKNIPFEVGVAGFANEPFTDLMTPSLTSLDQHSTELGKEAAYTFLHITDTEDDTPTIPAKLIIEPTLIIRESTARNLSK